MTFECTTTSPVFVPTAATIARSQLTDFMRFCERETGRRWTDYFAFEDFCSAQFREFWALFLAWSGCRTIGSAEVVCDGEEVERAVFFPQLALNYVENLLCIDSPFDGNAPAVREHGVSGDATILTRQQLRDRVVALARSLQALGATPQSRVVAVMHNDAAAVVGALATLAIGATFSSAAPEMGTDSILARFSQLEPQFLLGHLEDVAPVGTSTAANRLADVARGLPSLVAVVALDTGPVPATLRVPLHRIADLEAAGRSAVSTFVWEQFPFNHPLYVLFSSGTTGPPKCIIHGAGGTLLEHLKEHRLHTDLQSGDTLLFQTSTAWMMWHWQLTALASGATIVVNKQPLLEPRTLWAIAAAHAVTVIGTNPAYLKWCEDQGIVPNTAADLTPLRAVLSTGSILHARQYDWIRSHVGNLPVQSISGGTDILGCFVLGNPNLPVYRGQSQCCSLGLAVRAHDGVTAASRVGELICANPFPSRPLGLYGDPDGHRFHRTYFAEHPDVWTHGDRIEITAEGGARLCGRSDDVLNIRGVRVGPAEVYRILDDIPEVKGALAVEQIDPDDPEQTRLVLLVVTRAAGDLRSDLRERIRRDLAQRGSSAYVPAILAEVESLPTTFSGKLSERAARDVLNGEEAVNGTALRNPDCLAVIRWQVRLEDRRRVAAAANGSSDLEPLNPRLTRLLTLWQEVLGPSPVGADDNFYDLGGTSLTALNLFRRVREQEGVELPLSTLYTAPTPRALDTLMGAPPRAAHCIELSPGVGRPIFMMHDITGDLFYQRFLVQRLHVDRPVFGCRAAEVSGGPFEPLMSVEEMANRYLEHIRLVQPHGPYTLVGYSFGGLVAFEIARQLDSCGEQVAHLCLVDSYVHESAALVQAWNQLLRLLGRAAKLGRDPTYWVPRLIRSVARRYASWLHVAPETSHPSPPGLASCMAANQAYRPGRYTGEVHFVRAAERVDGYEDPVPAWSRVVSTPLLVSSTPGNHFSMVLPAHVATLACQVALPLNGARKVASGTSQGPNGGTLTPSAQLR